MKKPSLYILLKSGFSSIRMFALPNPFDTVRQVPTIEVLGAPIPLTPKLLNIIAEPFVHITTYIAVRLCGYTKGKAPVMGACLYMFFYIVHTGMVYSILSVWPSTIIVVLIFIMYSFLLLGLRMLLSKVILL